MKSAGKVFDSISKPYGGYLSVSTLPTNLQRLLKICFEISPTYLDDPEKPISQITPITTGAKKIFHGLVKNWEVNAFATVFKDVYLLGSYAGMPLAFIDFFTSLLARQDIFQEIGNINIEQKKPSFNFSQFLNYNEFVILSNKKSNASYMHLFPRDPERQMLAFQLAILAIKFIISHEFGHIQRGHIDYLHKKYNQTIFFEFNDTSNSNIDTETMQALELDADRVALHLVYISIKELLLRESAKKNIGVLCSDTKNLIKFFTFLMGCIFLILNGFSKNFNPSSIDSHPTARMRARIASNYLADWLVFKENKIDEDEAWSAIESAVHDLTKVIDLLGAFGSPLKYNKDEGDVLKKEIQLIKRLNKKAETFLPHLIVDY